MRRAPSSTRAASTRFFTPARGTYPKAGAASMLCSTPLHKRRRDSGRCAIFGVLAPPVIDFLCITQID
jgi:hypothetical protein